MFCWVGLRSSLLLEAAFSHRCVLKHSCAAMERQESGKLGSMGKTSLVFRLKKQLGKQRVNQKKSLIVLNQHICTRVESENNLA